MPDGGAKRPPFRYDYSLPVLERLVAGPVIIILAIGTVAGAIDVTARWRRGDAGIELSLVVMVSGIAAMFIFGVFAWFWGWIERASWSLGIDDGTLYWSSKGKETRVPCAGIASITIRTWGDFPDMKIVMVDGTRESVPSDCLGDFDKFCEAIHVHAPQAIVTFDGCGTCTVCGRPTRMKPASRFPDGSERQDCFCKLHRAG